MTREEMQAGNNVIASFMPNMIWIIPTNKAYSPYWRKTDKEGLPLKDYKAGKDLLYHYYWNDLKPVVDELFKYSLAFRDETEKLRSMKIVVDILPCWKQCIECINALKLAGAKFPDKFSSINI